jgi:hypothetical protein
MKVLDRDEWASILKEAKAKLKRPQCHREKQYTCVGHTVSGETR